MKVKSVIFVFLGKVILVRPEVGEVLPSFGLFKVLPQKLAFVSGIYDLTAVIFTHPELQSKNTRCLELR